MSEVEADAGDTEPQLGELNLPMPVNHSPLPRFANLHLLFSKLASIHGSGSIERRHEAINKFLDVWRAQVGDDIYPFVRLWFPEEDEQLKQLRRIKDTMVAKLLVEALDLPVKSPDAIMLMDVRRGAYTVKRGSDDGISAKAKLAIEQRYTQKEYSSWRLDEVAEKLVKLAQGRKQERVNTLKEFIETMNSDEMYWLIKIILGNVSLGCSVRTFLSVLHPDAIKVYLVNKNLKMVCRQLWSHNFQVKEVDKYVHLFSHFCPMRARFVKGAAEHMDSVVQIMCSPAEAQVDQLHDVASAPAYGDASFYIEEKVDGVRIQLHWSRESDSIIMFSRNGKDHTLSYQGIFHNQSVEDYYDGNPDIDGDADTKKTSGTSAQTEQSFSIKDTVADHVNSCILDGEVVAWDPETSDICGQSKVRELTAHRKGSRYRHMLLVFDVVYVNGRVLTEEPLKARKLELETLLPPDKRSAGNGRIQLLPYKLGHSVKDISHEFNKIVSQMSEGLVVKHPDSFYEIDGRNNTWIKVKPEFVDGYQGENLDLIIVGCYWGSGKHSNSLSSYLCALRDETADGKRYVALSRVGSGICLAMYEYINEKIEPHRFAQSKPPPWLVLGNERAPDFYVDPSVSVVFEVKYSMISSVTAEKTGGGLGYGVGYSLRFPRYVKLREDKNVKSALTISEFLHMHEARPALRTATVRSAVAASLSSGSRKAKSARIRDESSKTHVTNRKSDVFSGMEFYICGDINDPEFKTTAQLEQLIREHGGKTTSIFRPDAIPVSDSNVPNAVKLLSNDVKIVHPRYLFDCINNGLALRLEPSHYFGAAPPPIPGEETVDKFGFSLYREQSRKEIERLFWAIDTVKPYYSRKDMLNAVMQLNALRGGSRPLRASLFAGFAVYIKCNLLENGMWLSRNKLLYGGAEFVDNIIMATHILANDNNLDKDARLTRSEYPVVISKEWVDSCWQESKLVALVTDNT